MQAKFHIRYASDRCVLLSALFYIEEGSDLFCWHAEQQNHQLAAAFYVLENFYSEQACVLHRSLEDDVHGPWAMETDLGSHVIRCPVPECLCSELERLQSRFVEEWLFFLGDPAATEHCNAYKAHHLPLHEVNIHLKKLARMASHERIWEHCTAGFDTNVLEFLQKHLRMVAIPPRPA